MELHIITRCSRVSNILRIKESIDLEKTYWHILFDTHIVNDIGTEVLSNLQDPKIILKFNPSSPGDYGHNLINSELDCIKCGWVYILDDDNILHENFYSEIFKLIKINPDKKAFIFSQYVGRKDFSGLEIREAKPENIKVGHIDMCQFLLQKDFIGNLRLRFNEYKADGYFIEELYSKNPDSFYISDKILCYYNYINKEKMPIFLPRILLIGEDIKNLRSTKYLDFEEDKFNKKFIEEKNLNEEITKFNPDSIITTGKDFWEFPEMCRKSADFRKRWLNFKDIDPNIGECAYQSSMSYILSDYDSDPLVSFFTPFFNTGEKLKRTYDSLKKQTYDNWEWVLVNDSNDEGKTLKIAENIALKDPRVKVYDFKVKSGGIIGEAKYRSAVLCRGKYLMELDHDDILTNDAVYLMVKGFQTYSDCKFVYSDCAEIDESHNSLTYGDDFCFGYGSYRKEIYEGREYSVANSVGINPKTIRHIVGVPNHFRAWDREFYLSIGGHNRRLTIADDYELIVRSFLKTKFLRIPKLCYLQFFHNSNGLNNTQNSSRADIQRRVRTIATHYNEKIHQRFIELGVKDWAYDEFPYNPLLAESKFGDNENLVNYTMEIL